MKQVKFIEKINPPILLKFRHETSIRFEALALAYNSYRIDNVLFNSSVLRFAALFLLLKSWYTIVKMDETLKKCEQVNQAALDFKVQL